MDKLNMSLDQIIKLQKKEKKQMQNKVAQAQKMKGSQKKRTGTTGKGFKQFRARVGKKKVAGAAGGKPGISPLNRARKGQNQGFKQTPKKGMKTQQLKARQAVKQAQRKLQQKYSQQNRKNQRNQTFNQRRGIAQKTQNAGIKQRLGFRRGQGQQQQRGRINRNTGGVGTMRMDIVAKQQTVQRKRINRQPRNQINRQTGNKINRQTGNMVNRQVGNRINRQVGNQQRQISNQQPIKKRRWGRTQQNISTNPILQVSVPNKPTKSVSVKLSPNRQQNPQQRRLTNKVFQVQVAQERQQKKQVKQQQPQQSRLINNMLAQSQRQQQALANQVSHLQAVIANIQSTSKVKQNLNINRSAFAQRSTGLSLNDRFTSSAPQPTVTQMVPQTTPLFGMGRGGRKLRRNRNNPPQQTRAQNFSGQRMVFL